MFEISVASKYLTPRWRQLSVSIISLISILVIALVVWLIVVFFSVTNGLEKSWIDKLIALTSPVRLTPTEAYYRSYYHRIDSISSASDYVSKTLGEKLNAPVTDPYDASMDEEIPKNWPKPDFDESGHLKDLAKMAYEAAITIPGVPGLKAKDFEMTAANVHLQLLRPLSSPAGLKKARLDHYSTSAINQGSYLGSFDSDNSTLTKTVLPLTMMDLNQVYAMIDLAADNGR
jgi:lipoprotein-releasing system permease protein